MAQNVDVVLRSLGSLEVLSIRVQIMKSISVVLCLRSGLSHHNLTEM